LDYFLPEADGKLLDARMTIESGCVTLHSRSGRPRSAPTGKRGRNPDYVAAFDTIFDRLGAPTNAIERVLLDSAPAKAFPEELRVLAGSNDFAIGSLQSVKDRVRSRMRAFGRKSGMPANEGNQNKKIRIETNLTEAELAHRLLAVPTASAPVRTGSSPAGTVSGAPLPIRDIQKVTPDHVIAALARLSAGDPAPSLSWSGQFEAKTGDGRPYSPEEVFGLAIEEALGIVVRPGDIHSGWGTPAFELLEEAGLWIVAKPGSARRPNAVSSNLADVLRSLTPTDEELAWIEGNPRIAVHLVKERHPGLAAKKRSEFINAHGRLFCEHCGLDPIETYGADAGSACIEIHHHRTHVAAMAPGHGTVLADLKCLCSNCHRVLHRSLSLGVPFEI
jgi:5-methylcytosine-specific restriction protein A